MRLRKSLLAIPCVTLVGLAGFAIAPTAVADSFAPPSDDSIVYIKTTYTEVTVLDPVEEMLGVNLDKPVEVSGTCSGWVAKVADNDAVIVTARHCVDMEYGKNAVRKRAGSDVDVTRIVTVVKASTLSGEFEPKPRIAQVLDVMPVENGDVAVLRVSGLAQPVFPLPLATSQGNIGDAVATVGFPAASTHTSPRLITTYGTLTSESSPIEPNGEYVVTSDASTSNGASGGPIVNSDGQVVGMTSKGYKGMDVFTYPVDWFTLVNFLGRNGIEPASNSVAATVNEIVLSDTSVPGASTAYNPLAGTWDVVTSGTEFVMDKVAQGFEKIDNMPTGQKVAVAVAVSLLFLLLVWVWWVQRKLASVSPRKEKRGVSHRRN